MSGWLLTAAQRQRLERELTLACDAAFFRRVLALLELDADRPLEEVARQLRVAPRSLYRWLERYRTNGSLEGLRHQSGQGRPLRWDERLEERLASPRRWPGGPATLVTWPRVGPFRCCSRCWPRAGPSPPSQRTRSDGACTSAAMCGSASVTY